MATTLETWFGEEVRSVMRVLQAKHVSALKLIGN
jgi:hypothetical protein